MLRDTAVPELAQVDMKGIEVTLVTLADPDPPTAAEAPSPFREKVQAMIDGINQQLPVEIFCQIVFEIPTTGQEGEEKPSHLSQALQRIVRFG